MPDATIIGGGPAGAIAAIRLARGGWDITLVEQHRFPRDKVCGECLSAIGIDVLHDLDLLDHIRSTQPIELIRALVHAPDGRTSISLNLPRPMWGISRNILDTTLLAAAVESGVRVLQPARCERVIANGSIDTHIRNLQTNEVTPSRPSWLILADGKSALLSNRPAPTADLGIRGHFTNADASRDAIQLFGVDGHYGGLAPIENGYFNVAFSIPARRVTEANGDLGAVFAQILRENPVLGRQLRSAEQIGKWTASPLPRHGLVRDWPRHVIPVGNAAAAIEPIGGEGMGLAMRSAQLAAVALLSAEATGNPFNSAALHRAYKHLWRTRPTACRAAAMAVSRPAIASAAMRVIRAAPRVGEAALRLMGKTPMVPAQTRINPATARNRPSDGPKPAP